MITAKEAYTLARKEFLLKNLSVHIENEANKGNMSIDVGMAYEPYLTIILDNGFNFKVVKNSSECYITISWDI